MRRAITAVLLVLSLPAWGWAEQKTYTEVTQAELVTHRDDHQGQAVTLTGTFLFTGSDFCYQIRKTKINTRDYFCFALGTPSLVRLYLKKSSPQADELLHMKKGSRVTVFGTFDYLGRDYNFLIVDTLEIEPSP